MRKLMFGVAFSLFVLVAWFGQNSPPKAADNRAVQQFEYHRIRWGGESDQTMSTLGSQGWEMCGVVPKQPVEETVVIFKRAK